MGGQDHPGAHAPVTRRGLCAALCASALAGLAGCGGAGRPAGSSPRLATVSDGAPRTRRVTLAMAGDVLVHPGVWMSGERPDGTRCYDHLFARVRPALEAADIAIVNQETVLGTPDMGYSGYPSFSSPQEFGDAEAAAGVDVALSATNHALDRGYAGIEATAGFWRERHPEVACAGIATSREGLDAFPVLERDGVRVAILNYTASTNGIPLPADAPWCVSLLDGERVAADVARARSQGADAVVACPHWGTEYRSEPTSEQRGQADLFLELGVDVVIGTHPHVLEPVEVLERADGHRTVVFWSLGNLVSYQARKDAMVGGLAGVTLERGGGGLRVAAASLTPLVTHIAPGTAFTTYPISEYTEELAADNAIRRSDGAGDFSLAWCHDLCSRVLGPGYDAARGVLDVDPGPLR